MTSERVHYNPVCDEGISLRCANQSCTSEIEPGGMLIVSSDGTVYCSESCAPRVPSES